MVVVPTSDEHVLVSCFRSFTPSPSFVLFLFPSVTPAALLFFFSFREVAPSPFGLSPSTTFCSVSVALLSVSPPLPCTCSLSFVSSSSLAVFT